MIRKFLMLSLLGVSTVAFSQKIIVTPSFGFGWRTAKMPDGISSQEREYIRNLKSGTNFDISAAYIIKGAIGLGAKFSVYSASSTTNYVVNNGFGNSISMGLRTKDNITYIGPALVVSNLTEETRHKLLLNVSLGYMSYNTTTNGIEGTGGTLGAELDAAYQYQINQNLFIGPKLGLSGGTLNKMKFDGVTYEFDDEEKEGLQRVSLSAAVTFRF